MIYTDLQWPISIQQNPSGLYGIICICDHIGTNVHAIFLTPGPHILKKRTQSQIFTNYDCFEANSSWMVQEDSCSFRHDNVPLTTVEQKIHEIPIGRSRHMRVFSEFLELGTKQSCSHLQSIQSDLKQEMPRPELQRL